MGRVCRSVERRTMRLRRTPRAPLIRDRVVTSSCGGWSSPARAARHHTAIQTATAMASSPNTMPKESGNPASPRPLHRAARARRGERVPHRARQRTGRTRGVQRRQRPVLSVLVTFLAGVATQLGLWEPTGVAAAAKAFGGFIGGKAPAVATPGLTAVPAPPSEPAIPPSGPAGTSKPIPPA